MTPEHDHGLLELERGECLALLGSVPVGRLVHTAHALPAIWPCNFVLLPDAVYLRTSRGSGAWRAADATAVVAFEADDVDAQGRYGWSVVVIGRAGLVTDAATLLRLGEVLTAPWATGGRDEVVRISLELVDGRRAGAPARLHERHRHPGENGPQQAPDGRHRHGEPENGERTAGLPAG